MSLRDQAVAWAERGFRVFPLIAQSKLPRVKEFYDVATSDPEKVAALWSDPVTGWPQDFNIGVSTDHLIVVDIDMKGGKNGLRSRCRKCCLDLKKIAIAKNPDKYAAYSRAFRKRHPATAENKEYKRNHELKRLYGLSIDQYDAMVTEQKGLCAICHRPPSGPRPNDKVLHVDHDHVTGKVRGLLCGIHNRALGGFQDNLNYLLSAGEYLTKARETT